MYFKYSVPSRLIKEDIVGHCVLWSSVVVHTRYTKYCLYNAKYSTRMILTIYFAWKSIFGTIQNPRQSRRGHHRQNSVFPVMNCFIGKVLSSSCLLDNFFSCLLYGLWSSYYRTTPRLSFFKKRSLGTILQV